MPIPTTYVLDGTVDLRDEAVACHWRLPVLIRRLLELRYDPEDAGAFAQFIFATQESYNMGETDLMPWDYLTEAQLERVRAVYPH